MASNEDRLTFPATGDLRFILGIVHRSSWEQTAITRWLEARQFLLWMQYQAALNLAGEWLAETLGVPVEQVVQEWEFDGRQFKRLKAENEKA